MGFVSRGVDDGVLWAFVDQEVGAVSKRGCGKWFGGSGALDWVSDCWVRYLQRRFCRKMCISMSMFNGRVRGEETAGDNPISNPTQRYKRERRE